MSPRILLAAFAVLGPVACDSMVESGESSTSTGLASSSSATAESTSDAPPSPTTSGSTGPGNADGTTTTAADDDGYEEDDGGTGCTFTCPNPPPPTPPPGGGGGGGGGTLECDLDTQDCPEGEKCMPWANDGGTDWNSTRCSPIADNPTQAGDVCLVEGSGWSGIDDCDLGLVCWQVDPQTNQGICHPLCTFDGAQHVCETPLACTEVDVMRICIQPCDPLDAASCPEGLACAFMGSSLVCQAEGPTTAGMPCDAATVCEAGTLCSYDAALDCGNGVGQGCCAVPCDVNDPVACTEPEVCVPWFPLPAPPALAYLGVCAAP